MVNVCIIGDFSGNSDEGMKLVAQNLANKLSETQNLFRLDIHKALSLSVLREIRRFRPDILHYVSGPSPISFILLRTLLVNSQLQSRKKIKTVMSATQPWLPFNSGSFLKYLKPDLLLSQSSQQKSYFETLGFNVKYLPNGVDLSRFKPVTDVKKQELRAKYGLSDRKHILLHVGSVRERRGLDVMKSIAKLKDWTVLIIGTTSSPLEKQFCSELVDEGCLVWREYIPEIHEIYQLSDVYAFPVENELGCIELPLSVLEAMACNLLVMTTKYGGFPELFTEGEGFYFVNNRNEMPEKLKTIFNEKTSAAIQTRKKVSSLSWETITKNLAEFYCDLINCENIGVN
jgi:glycosyltransferase involved in cell wall biosynthesis